MHDNDYLVNHSFQRYLIPSILAILGGNISFMVDHIIAGQVLGSDALAAMSLVNPLFFLLTTLGTLVCVGSSTLASVSMGSEDRSTANKLFTLTMLLILLLGTVFSIIGFIFIEPLVKLLSNDPELYDLVYAYCRGLIPGAICIMAVYLPLNYFRIEGRAFLGMIMFLIMAALDIILDLWFTVVMGMGMLGLALATVISALLAVAVMSPFLFIKGGGYRFAPIGQSLRLVYAIAITGSPPALNNLYSVVRTFVLNMLILAVGGPIAVASFAFVNSVNTLAQAIISGISQTVSPLVGVFYGERDVLSIKKVVFLAFRYGIITMAIFSISISLLAKPICLAFNLSSPEQLHIAVPALIISSISLLGAVVNNIFVYYYMTIGRTSIANRITLFRGFLFIIPAAGAMAQAMGILGIWAAFSISELLTLLMTILTIRKTLLKEPDLRGLLLLNYRDVAEGRFIAFSVDSNNESVLESSDKISEFCTSCKLNSKQSMVISLAIEEILLLMVQHIFVDKKNKSIDVRIFVRDDITTMRFRCAGRKFNPLDYYQHAMEHADTSEALALGESMGLQMITKMTKQVDYTTSLGLNNIIIRI